MLILRIKQAEFALAEGRLDEAFEIARNEDVRQHRRGQQLIGKLSKALVDRGLNHLSNNRTAQALSDCNKAEKLGGNLPEIAQLRQAILQAGNGRQQQQQQRAVRIAQAREHIRKGWFSAGEQMLNDIIGDGGEADLLMEKIVAQRLDMETAATKAEEALQRGDLAGAFQMIMMTGQPGRQNRKLAELLLQIESAAIARTKTLLREGRIDQGHTLLQKLQPLAEESLELQELNNICRKFYSIGGYIAKGQPRRAGRLLEQSQEMLPEANWIKQAAADARKAADGLEALHAGPLGRLLQQGQESGISEMDGININAANGNTESYAGKNLKTEKPLPDLNEHLLLPDKFFIQVDGVGSYLVLRKELISIGPISSSRQVDIGLVTEPDVPVMLIERMDEDYFLRCDTSHRGPLVPAEEKLLRDGEDIELSRRCKLKFRIPNVASSSAKLIFSGVRYPRLDVREAILMHREIIIAAGSAAHIRCERCKEKIVLYINKGRLYCRSGESVEVDGKVQPEQVGLPLEKPINIGGLSLVLTRAETTKYKPHV